MSDDTFVESAVQAAASGGGFAGVFLFLRWAVAVLTGRADKREQKLDAQDARLDAEWKQIREDMKRRLERIEKQNEALRFAFHHVAGALIRVDPNNPALAQAETLLNQAFPVDFRLIAERAGAALDLGAAAPPVPPPAG